MEEKKKEPAKARSFIYSMYGGNEWILDTLESCKNENGLVIIQMEHVNRDFINEAYRIVGKRLRIMPTYGQYKKRTGSMYYPYYSYSKIMESEMIFDIYISSFKDHKDKDGDIKRLSPFEKFIAAYILTENFSQYKEEDNAQHSKKNVHVSRSVYEFVNKSGDKRIVCTGYVNLLREFLYRLKITDTASIGFYYIKGPMKEHYGHTRMLIHLKDEKYNMDGVYLSDPTFDNDADGLCALNVENMLMTYDEVIKLDKRFELDLSQGWNGRNKLLSWQIEEGDLNLSYPEKYFNRVIPKETIVKGFLAVNRFLDKNMKMVNNNEYDLLEYCEMAERLTFYEEYRKHWDRLLNEFKKMTLNEIKNNYPALINTLIRELLDKYNNKLFSNDNQFNIIVNKESNNISFGINLNKENYDSTNIKAINNYQVLEQNGCLTIYLPVLDNNQKLGDELDKLEDNLRKLLDICTKTTSKENNNRVK